MATVVVTNDLSALEREHNTAAEKARVAGEKADGLRAQVLGLEGEIATLTESYNQACRDQELGRKTNIAKLKADLDSRRDRITGLRQLAQEAGAEFEPLSKRRQTLAAQLQSRRDDAEIERLEAAQVNAKRAHEEAELRLRDARNTLIAASDSLARFHRSREMRARRRAAGLES
jgi:dsDNA-specific endonuclease/ATPase MutS2